MWAAQTSKLTYNSKSIDSLPVHSQGNGFRFLPLFLFFYPAAEKTKEEAQRVRFFLHSLYTHTWTRFMLMHLPFEEGEPSLFVFCRAEGEHGEERHTS